MRQGTVLFLLPSLFLPVGSLLSAPTALREDISIRRVLSATQDAAPVRIDLDPVSGELHYVLQDGGIFRVDLSASSPRGRLVYTEEDTGIDSPRGFAFGPDGTMYLVGNERLDRRTRAIIRKGVRGEGTERVWRTLASTVPYPGSQFFSHEFNGIAVSPDGRFVYVNSGSRTDHGEIQDNRGTFPGVRETPITSAIFRLPSTAEDLTLEDDERDLRDPGYLFADGVRNSFDLAFAPNGDLFATENSGDRDDSEEINWIREGHHYGFPWRIGTSDTPMQFPGYDPGEDPLINPGSLASRVGLFYDDPDYPPPPPGVVFTGPVANDGPHGDTFRDPESGRLIDGSASGTTVGTLTAHRSPLGLVFDTESALGGPFQGDGFVLSWTRGSAGSGTLLEPLDDPGEDLLHLELTKGEGNYRLEATRIAAGFDHPVDAVLVENRLYVIETGGDGSIWELTLPARGEPLFRRGFVNADPSIDLSDPITILLALFRGAPLACEDAADVNDDGRIEVADAVHLLGHLFGGDLEPLAAPSSRCGTDPTDDALTSGDECEQEGPCR